MSSRATDDEIQDVFQRFLGRSCEAAAADIFKRLNFTADKLAAHVIRSPEYRQNNYFGTDANGEIYYFAPPARENCTHPLAHHGRGDTYHLLHSFFDRTPDLSFELRVEAKPAASRDVATARRIIAAYRRAIDQEASLPDRDRRTGGVWSVVGATHHREALGLLEAADAQGLAAYLANALQSPLSYGLLSQGHLQSEQAAALLAGNVEIASRYKLLMKDSFVRLGEALGALPVENPEQGRYGDNIHIPLESLIDLIEETLGVRFDRPQIAGMFGLICQGKLYDVKAAEDAYLAWRISCMGDKSAIEIGGGFGGLAFQLSRVGVASTVFDLPVVNALQGFFLIRALGEKKVALFGEAREDAIVTVMPWQSFFTAGTPADLLVNRDSMAEFPLAVAQRYCVEIRRRSLPFLSVNQEVENDSGDPGVRQVNVGRVAASAGLIRQSRHLYWLRKGYVEELFG